MDISTSEQLHEKAQKNIVGGVNSPSRTYKGVGGGTPLYMERAKGAYFWDVDGNKYIDYLAAFGPIITGHAHPKVTKAITEQAEKGVLYGTPTKLENILAEKLKSAIPSLDKVRFVNSGTEAVMSTVRVGRAYTGRNKIIKFSGCYHGHFDSVLVEAGSGPATLGTPDSAGVPKEVANDVITVPFNDANALDEALKAFEDQVAAVIVEPIVGNFGIVAPHDGFLKQINELAHRHGSLVIYDEIISAFRFTYGSAQTLYNVEPDMTAMGKIIGGGLPIGAYGGREDIMEQVAPLGPAYQAGTMAGNPASMTAGIACLEVLEEEGVYQHLDNLGEKLEKGIRQRAVEFNIPITLNRVCGALTVFFGDKEVHNYDDADATDGEAYGTFFKLMQKQGIHLAPSKFEAWFLTTAHTEKDIDETIAAVGNAFSEMVTK